MKCRNQKLEVSIPLFPNWEAIIKRKLKITGPRFKLDLYFFPFESYNLSFFGG